MPKFAFVMRGVPGSGKSTTAKRLAGHSGIIHAVDDYHKTRGEFLWDDDRKDEYYNLNFSAFVESLDAGVQTVVCDCINVTRDEYEKYVNAAQERGYTTATVTMASISPASAASRNKHSVNVDQITEMYEKWED